MGIFSINGSELMLQIFEAFARDYCNVACIIHTVGSSNQVYLWCRSSKNLTVHASHEQNQEILRAIVRNHSTRS